jgi:hypothetical protein
MSGTDGISTLQHTARRAWRSLAVAAALLAWGPLQAQDFEPPLDSEVEGRIEADLNGDGIDDYVYLAGNEDSRALSVLLSEKAEVHVDHRPEVLVLDPASFGPGSISVDGNVLKFEDLTGGTTAVASTHRFRYDPAIGHMRLIGLDATLYSRTYAHDGFELSWNLLSGDLITRKLHLNTGEGDAAYDKIDETRSKRRSDPVWLSESPNPEDLIFELSGG